MEEIATRAGVGVGTVYRRFASKDALIDELVRLAMEEVTAAAERALARTDGHGLEEFLRAIGQSFADHARYANLLLERPVDPRATQRLRDAVGELTARAAAAGAVAPGVTQATSWRWSGPCAAWCTTRGRSRAGRGSLTSTWPAC